MIAKTDDQRPFLIKKTAHDRAVFLFLTSFALAAGKHGNAGKTNKDVEDSDNHRHAAENRFNQVEVKESYQPPVDGANEHKQPGELVNAAHFFHHHRKGMFLVFLGKKTSPRYELKRPVDKYIMK